MRENLSQPKVTRSSQRLHISYEIPQLTHSVKVYPFVSFNGSTIILIGHENGVKIIWRGGRQFLTPRATTTATHKVNGSGPAIVSLDSDGKETASMVAYEDQPEFMEIEEEFDPLNPYPGILQTLDLSFETAVLQLAILPLSILKSYELCVGKCIIFVGACADNSLRLVTLPLNPPSPLSKVWPEPHTANEYANAGNGKWGEKVFFLNGHEKPSNGVSMTVDLNNGDPQFIIASFSYEVNGRLLLWCCSVERPALQMEPFHSISLATLVKSISFNPSPSRPNYLLVAEAKGVCRIFEYILPNCEASVLDILSTAHGRWILSIMTEFSNFKNMFLNSAVAHVGLGRKAIADAKWVLDGSAILVLLDEGEWGIWDIEGLRIGTGNSQGLLQHHGIKGGSKSKFSLTGLIDSSKKTANSAPPSITASKFAPMTPGTRRSIDPFSNQATILKKGQISVIEIPPSSSTSRTDEAILFRLGTSYAVIPSILKYWSAHFGNDQSSDIFGSMSRGRIVKFEEVSLQGERCSAAELIPISTSTTESTIPQMVILGEHRFIVINSERSMASSLTKTMATTQKPTGVLSGTNSDQLDITGIGTIEIALEKMEERNRSGSKKRGLPF